MSLRMDVIINIYNCFVGKKSKECCFTLHPKRYGKLEDF